MSSVRMERAGKILAKSRNNDTISPEELAHAAWLATVGKRIAAKASAKALVRGSLIVEVEDAIWQKQLFHLRYDILAKLTSVIGGGIVTGLEFRIATPRRPPQIAQSHSETASLDEADRIEDPVLRILYKQSRQKAAKKATA
jgi:Dna[CI] antecedent, DciA